jgi:hypothetical protein
MLDERHKQIHCYQGDTEMKKAIATVVSALAAVSFAGIVMAADMPAGGDTSTAPSATSGQPGTEQAAKPVKKHKKVKKHHKKHHKKAMKKGATTGSQTPASQGEVAPQTPSAPAAK